MTQSLTPAWKPTKDLIQATNIAKALTTLQLPDYQAFHRWSVEHYQEFWRFAIEQLGIQFVQTSPTICDLTLGVERPIWLPNAKLNIAQSCFMAPADKPAIIAQNEYGQWQKMSYAELDKQSNQIANSIVKNGFKPKDALAIFMPMNPLAVAIYLGIIKAGCVAVGIAESFAVEEIATRLKIANVKAIFSCHSFTRAGKPYRLYEKLQQAAAPTVVLTEGIADPARTIDLAWNSFIQNTTEFRPIIANPNDHINILFSSGTTGEPKAIPWTHTTPLKCATDAYFHHDIQATDVLAWPTSLGWMMGPWLIFATLLNRATMAIYEGLPTGRDFGEFVQDAKVTMLGLVPSLVKTWRASGCMQGLDWQAIKCFSSTGECSNADDMRYLMELAGNKPVIEYCGGTEIGGAYISGTLVQAAIPATFTGPTLGIDIVLFDEQGNLTDKGEVGIIGPSIGLSTELLNRDHSDAYFAGMPRLTNEQLLRRHGDEFERLANGYYRALGRADDTMNLSGIKISSVEIERVLNNLAQIKETAAIAVKPAEGGPDQLVIYAVLEVGVQQNSTMWLKIMQQAIKEHLNPLFKIQQVKFIASLPRTASNKIMRRTLRNFDL